jgi:penicillin-binding protein activator
MDFSSTDLQGISTKMVDGMLADHAVIDPSKEKPPVIFIGGLDNQTSEHINTQSITDAIATRLIQSRKFQFIDMAQVEKVKQQLNFQKTSGMVDQAQASQIGQQIGARYMLYGTIASIDQRNDKQQTLFLQISMRLLDIQSGIIVWADEKQIGKKAVKKGFGW